MLFPDPFEWEAPDPVNGAHRGSFLQSLPGFGRWHTKPHRSTYYACAVPGKHNLQWKHVYPGCMYYKLVLKVANYPAVRLVSLRMWVWNVVWLLYNQPVRSIHMIELAVPTGCNKIIIDGICQQALDSPFSDLAHCRQAN